jgi:hypothetical protein
MANKKIYTKIEIEAVKQGLNHYFPFEVGDVTEPKTVDDTWSDINRIFKWRGRDDFFTTLSEVTGVQKLSSGEIRSASGILEKMEKSAPKTAEFKSAEESPVEANRPSKEKLEQLEEENVAKETHKKEVIEKSNQEVRTAIKRRQEIYAEEVRKAKATETALKNQKIYYRVEEVPIHEETQEIKNLREQAKADPKKFIEDTAKQFSQNPNIRNLPPEELDIISRQAAVTTYDVLTDNSPVIQSAIISRVVSNPKTLNSITDINVRESFKSYAEVLTNQKIAQFELGKQFLDFSKIDGVKSPDDIKIEFSNSPQPGFKEFDFNQQIVAPHIETLDQQNFLLDNLRGFGEGEIKSRILLGIGEKLTNYVAGLPTNSLLAQTYNSELVQLGLSSLGFVEAAPWVAVEGSWIGNLAVGSGYGPLAGFIQAKTGIDLGVQIATKTVGTEVASTLATEATAGAVTTTAATVGTEVAATATGAAVGTGAGIAIGQVVVPIPVVGAAIGAVVGWVAGKIPWKKIKEWSAVIVGGLVGLVALPFVGAGTAIGIGIGGTAITAAFGGGVGGLTLGGVGGGILSFFKTLGTLTLGAIGTPILITLLVFPLAVALILFIINSGAYVVPGDASIANSANPYIGVEKTATPSGQLTSPTLITYTVTITAKKDALSAINFSNTCQGIKKGGGNIDCKNLEQIPAPPASISPGSPFTFSFTSNYNSKFQDMLVSDTITVDAKSNEGGRVTDVGSASVCFGNCPLDCFAFPEKYWGGGNDVQNLKSLLTGAASTLASQYPNFAQKACAAGTVNLCYNPGAFAAGFFGFHEHSSTCDIDFNIRSAAYGPEGVLFLLTHEATHHIQAIAGHYLVEFEDRVAPTEPSVCTYGGSVSEESMAEGDALYVARPIIDANFACLTNYQSQYPKHYNFAKSVMFAP